jgi:hypothetical protein
MAYGVVHRFPGGTKEQYEASVARVHPSEGLPDGQVIHIAGPTDDGWIVIAVHESRSRGSDSATTRFCPDSQRRPPVGCTTHDR